MLGPSSSRNALKSARRTYSAQGCAHARQHQRLRILREEEERNEATHPQLELPTLRLLLVHPLLGVVAPLVEVVLAEREQARDEELGELLHEAGRDGKARRAVPVAEERLEEEEGLDDEAGRVGR